MNVKQLIEQLAMFPEDMEVKINYQTYDNLSWESEYISEILADGDGRPIVYLCGEEKDGEDLTWIVNEEYIEKTQRFEGGGG